MQNILLLGGFGFIGTNILKFMDKCYSGKFIVTVVDRFDAHPAGVMFDCVERCYSGDYADISFLNKIFKENKIDTVIHAVSSSIPSLSNDAIFDLHTNVIPTINLLNVMVKSNAKDIVFLSSGGAIYGDQSAESGHLESDDVFPKSSYGISKLVIEKYLFQYADLHDLSPIILRLSNPYGPYHCSKKQGVINIAVRAALDNKPFFVWGDGNGEKDYIYIEDFCDILFRLINKNVTKTVVNVGSGELLSVNTILHRIKQSIPSFTWGYKDANKLDINRFKLNLDKLSQLIGKYTYTSFEGGLEKTIMGSK